MKKIVICAVALMLMLLSSCAPYIDAPDDTTGDSQVGVYVGLIELLRSELEELKKDQSEDIAKYEERIKELEDRLEALSKVTTVSPSTEPAPSTPFTYTETDGKLTLTGITDKSITVLNIPSEIDGKPVTAIADSAFSGSELVGVTLPSSVTEIGWFAFSGSVGLVNITVPASVTSIGYDAFSNCPKLTVYTSADSFAAKYAKSYGIKCVAPS